MTVALTVSFKLMFLTFIFLIVSLCMVMIVFLQTKVQYIKKTTNILKEKFNGDIPNTVKDLCSLPGKALYFYPS